MTSHASEEAQTRFLNVDLELVTTAEINALLAEWGELVMLRDSVDNGVRTIWIELEEDLADAEGTLGELLSLIESLPAPLRVLWDSCRDRCFNVGIQAGTAPHSSGFGVSLDTMRRIAAAGARLEFTVYGAATDQNR